MRFVSTRGRSPSATLSEALRNGAAPDGGLYLPDEMPQVDANLLDPKAPLAKFAATFLEPFFVGDGLEKHLPLICSEAFDFPVPLVTPDARRPQLRALELFHGPTGAFKDFGARFLMGCLDRLDEASELTVLAATSGDTGGAVGCATELRSSLRAVILFPKGRVSPFQEQQLTCWGSNVLAIEVDGDFDDCQRLVKAAFADPILSAEHRLTSANSINFGRLLPQAAYSGWAALQVFEATGQMPGFLIPSGNLGHGFALLLARALGLPVGPIVLATNANRTLKDWHDSGRYRARASLTTIASAMDVGNPSNFERLRAMDVKPEDVRVELVSDDQIRARIRSEYEATGYLWCPHSATAVDAWHRMPDRLERPWIAAATAHPGKFAEVVEPLIGHSLEPGPCLAAIAGRQSSKICIPAALDALAEVLASLRHGGGTRQVLAASLNLAGRFAL